MPPRKPGSQVAPGQRPLFTDGRTATTHSKVPIDQATAGRRYRVRDKHIDEIPGVIWGEDLDWATANRLKEEVVTARRSKTARVEDMEVPMPGDQAPVSSPPPSGSAFELEGAEPQTIPSKGVVFSIPDGHELLVDGMVAPVPSTVVVHPAASAAHSRAKARTRPREVSRMGTR